MFVFSFAASIYSLVTNNIGIGVFTEPSVSSNAEGPLLSPETAVPESSSPAPQSSTPEPSVSSNTDSQLLSQETPAPVCSSPPPQSSTPTELLSTSSILTSILGESVNPPEASESHNGKEPEAVVEYRQKRLDKSATRAPKLSSTDTDASQTRNVTSKPVCGDDKTATHSRPQPGRVVRTFPMGVEDTIDRTSVLTVQEAKRQMGDNTRNPERHVVHRNDVGRSYARVLRLKEELPIVGGSEACQESDWAEERVIRKILGTHMRPDADSEQNENWNIIFTKHIFDLVPELGRIKQYEVRRWIQEVCVHLLVRHTFTHKSDIAK
ncbi:hypothetical protein BJ508DRAFT_362173 [Ascobolus immersus RN42]|uniref:Uncharacterized protein n=1 Tax=Ascobolus immersus RN42 TaxID=1160509 RepID=A0A3N4I484_ASCIM|nr:hypothetical protein BJ508DRAFT_362173 [Ascobolus immersus RN42]